MLLSKTLRAAALLAAFALPALGCSDDNSPSGTTSLTVNMTDAAGDIKAAVVTISEIYLVGSGDQAHVTLTSTPVTTNLLDLANSTKTLVDAQDVTDGTYSELRFVITGGYVEVENDDGSTSIYASSSDYAGLPAGAAVAGQLQMPSLGQSGLKVDLPADALTLDGTAETLLLDFDVSQSFGHAAGNSGTWVMHPVIKGATFTEAAKAHATLALGTGVTLPDVAGSAITLADFSAVLTSSAGGTETQPLADTDADGTFDATFDFLLPGDYTVTFTGPAGLTFTTDPAGPIAVTAASGTTVDAGATVTAATPTP
jgi:autotransporter translocation and assembly factor TamB